MEEAKKLLKKWERDLWNVEFKNDWKWTHEKHNKWKDQFITSVSRVVRNHRSDAKNDLETAVKQCKKSIKNLAYHYFPER